MKDRNSVGEAALKLSEINLAQLAVNLGYNILRKLYQMQNTLYKVL